ncbi:MAG: 2-succinyl-6-hydroxy-2,4-cyclohexadiene-1-carboxylate synthase [Phototrophicales bacterium]|nr:MAG: 2-succinyl-6-hydroxy-2,4-cyclohexadiene-1-carboxylate synthase [Phototrophicales bacterium]
MFFASDGVCYCLRRWGKGEALLMLHGFTGSGRVWESLHFLGWRMCAVDLLGHGETDAPTDPDRYRIESAAADLASMLNEPVFVLGYSMGGRLALYLALHFPDKVRGLILESASPGLESEQERVTRALSDLALADAIERDGIAAFVDYWERLPLFASQTPDQRAMFRPIRLGQRPHGLANSLRGMGAGVQPSLWGRLHEIAIPTLILTGALDAKYCAIGERMASLMPHAQQVIIPNAGHTPHLEQPDAFHAAVQSFLRGAKGNELG